MENSKLTAKLRELARGAAPYKRQILKQAANRIEEQEKLLNVRTPEIVRISPNTVKALERMDRAVHGGRCL